MVRLLSESSTELTRRFMRRGLLIEAFAPPRALTNPLIRRTNNYTRSAQNLTRPSARFGCTASADAQDSAWMRSVGRAAMNGCHAAPASRLPFHARERLL